MPMVTTNGGTVLTDNEATWLKIDTSSISLNTEDETE